MKLHLFCRKLFFQTKFTLTFHPPLSLPNYSLFVEMWQYFCFTSLLSSFLATKRYFCPFGNLPFQLFQFTIFFQGAANRFIHGNFGTYLFQLFGVAFSDSRDFLQGIDKVHPRQFRVVCQMTVVICVVDAAVPLHEKTIIHEIETIFYRSLALDRNLKTV